MLNVVFKVKYQQNIIIMTVKFFDFKLAASYARISFKCCSSVAVLLHFCSLYVVVSFSFLKLLLLETSVTVFTQVLFSIYYYLYRITFSALLSYR